jgi:hypothetical protein
MSKVESAYFNTKGHVTLSEDGRWMELAQDRVLLEFYKHSDEILGSS